MVIRLLYLQVDHYHSGANLTLTGALSVHGAIATINLDGNYPVCTNNVALAHAALDD